MRAHATEGRPIVGVGMLTSIRPRKSAWIVSGLAVLGLHLGLSALVSAQDSATKPDETFSFFRVWILGGGGIGILFLLPIELLSIATMATTIEHFVNIQRDKIAPPEIIVELETLLDEEQYEEAINLCEASKNYMTNIIGAAVAHINEGYEAMENAAQGATEEENLKLQHKIQWLNLFGNLGPMMGLFGTVVGMVMAFTQIAMSSSTPSPQALALGIFTALVTTVWGLLVCMPALSFYFLFRLKVQKLCFELSGVAAEIVARFKSVAEQK